ncbi:hypothetical protein [Bradyrhizobium sp. SZCCHNS30571]|uniref:hypothetical protein n=1 Tax=Bradyrhizobium sp. SZCCHNS30571 TaxID=3057324 RepID=UPI002916CF49|nr:hypothetical protein [Bradyrhizobium sp. SZCCHNS30571]
MVRGFFEAHAERIGRIIEDSFPIFERFGWTLDAVEALEWDDFLLIADGVQFLNKRDQEAMEAAQKARGR